DQVVAARQLYVDLRERILDAVAQRDQTIVKTDEHGERQDDDRERYPAGHAPSDYCLPIASIAGAATSISRRRWGASAPVTSGGDAHRSTRDSRGGTRGSSRTSTVRGYRT